MSTRIAVAEDQRLIRELLAAMLSREPDFEVVAEAETGRDAIARVQSTRPDILVLDVVLPDLHGTEVARILRKALPALRILALSVHEEAKVVQEMFRAGVDGYVAKSAAAVDLVQAIRSLKQGQMYVSPSIARGIVGKAFYPVAGGVIHLAPRERQVLALVANGKHSAQIAKELSISVGTVEAHRRNIMAKLGLHTIAELTKYAVREGLTSL